MTEIDVDMAVYAIGQAVADLAAAARDPGTRGYVEANRERLIEDIGRLSESLAATREPAGAAAPRAGSIAAKRLRNALHPRRAIPGTRAGSRSHVG